MKLTPRTVFALMASVIAVAPFHTQAQVFPAKPLTLVAPFAAGGTSDVVARATARLMEGEVGQTVIVANRTGAGGTIGIGSVLAPPLDGHNLVMGGLGSVVFSSVLYKGRIKFDAQRDLAAVGVVGSAPTLIVVRAGLPVQTLADLLAQAKSNPDKLSFASAGVGGTLHVAGVLLEKEAGIRLNHIPYKGGAPAMTDLAAGSVDIALADLTLLKPLLQSGRVRPIAVASGERISALPDVPTTAELGYPKVRMDTWYALFAPSGIPPIALARLRTAFEKIQSKPELVSVLQAQGITPLSTPLKSFEEQVKRDFETWPLLLSRICSQNSCE
jgi:tripartite-type tricarboxylate transporter receptor subunit TctC